MPQSKIEQLILDKDFSYLKPYFYNYPYALRCELGIGDELYMVNAKNRAVEIFNILFPIGADAVIFNYWIYDHSDSGDAYVVSLKELELDLDDSISSTVEAEAERLRFLLEYQGKFRHTTVRDLETYGYFDDEYVGKERRNRVICYRGEEEFDYDDLIDRQITWNGPDIGFVSFENECIMSVYDDRGCDVFFATHEKMKEFYRKLEPYFLPYDAEEMKQRFNG